MAKRKITVEQVKEWAMERYEKGGDTIIECWDDEDIQRQIDEGWTKRTFLKFMREEHTQFMEIRNA